MNKNKLDDDHPEKVYKKDIERLIEEFEQKKIEYDKKIEENKKIKISKNILNKINDTLNKI